MNFKELQQFYTENYSLGYLNSYNGHSTIESRFILISLVNLAYSKLKLKNPDLTRYEFLVKLTKNNSLPDKFLKGLAIVCEDFAYGCDNYPNFGLKGNDILKEIQGILNSYLPF